MNSILYKLQRQPFWGLLFIYAAVFLVNGPGVTDREDFLAMAAHPFAIQVPIGRQFLYSSPLNFILARLFGLDSNAGFYVLHAVEIFLMLGCVALAVRKKIAVPDKQALFIILLSLTSLWLITFKWFGKTDPILIGGFFLCWAWRTHWRPLCAFVMIAAHRELGTLMVLFLYLLEERKDRNLLYALLAGNVLHVIYQFGILSPAPQSRPEVVLQDARLYLTAFARTPVAYVVSMFSWYWIVVLLQKPARKELAIFVVAFVLALPCNDFTRDFILMAFPALVFHLERVIAKPENDRLVKLIPLSVIQSQMGTHVPAHAFDNVLFSWLKG